MIKQTICLSLLVCLLLLSPAFSADLSVDGFYWKVNGSQKLLLGSSSEDNLFQLSADELLQELDVLSLAGGNYVRNVMSFRDPGNEVPYLKVDGQYDLNQWNPAYWDKLDFFFRETQKRNIIVQMEIWATFDYYRKNWADLNPFNPANNKNYGDESGLPRAVNSHPADHGNVFFYSVPTLEDLTLVRGFQEKFVAKILSYSLKYDHILYCIDNETSVDPEWGRYWAGFIRTNAEQLNKSVFITEMWNSHSLMDSQHTYTWAHPQTYQFVEVSQNTHGYGSDVYNNVTWMRSRLAGNPRPMTSVKIYGNKKYGTKTDAVNRFWTKLFAGVAAVRFHRPMSGIGGSDLALQHIRAARSFFLRFPLADAFPVHDLFDLNRFVNVYAMQSASGDVAVLFPAPYSKTSGIDRFWGTFYNLERRLELPSLPDSRWGKATWFLPEENLMLDPVPLEAGALLIPPDDRCWIVLLEHSQEESVR